MALDQPGTYVLILNLRRPMGIRIGCLGRFQFPAGWYAYVGSARGPGGLAARLARHLRSPKPLRWHVDYLRPHAQPVEIWHAAGSQKKECDWAQALSRLPGALTPVPRFGASDCRCISHLVCFPAPPDARAFANAVAEPVARKKVVVRRGTKAGE